MQVDKEAFEYAISKIDDGNIFELFGNDFLSAVLGYSFIPVGRTKDKGVDGFQHVFTRTESQKHIFQLSTELDHVGKIYGTITKLKENKIEFDRLVYVTNRKINNAESFIDEVFDKTKNGDSISIDMLPDWVYEEVVKYLPGTALFNLSLCSK